MSFDFGKYAEVPVDSFEATVPADFRPFYEKGDGGYRLSGSPAVQSAVRAISGFSSTLQKVRRELDETKKAPRDYGKLNEFGTTDDEILAKFQEQLAEASRKGSGDEVERRLKSAREQLVAAHGKEVNQLKEALGARTAAYDQMLVRQAVATAAVRHGGVDPDLLTPFVAQQIQVVEEAGHRVIRVMGADGSPRLSPSTGGAMSVEELVGELRTNPKYAQLFPSKVPTGAGFKGGPAVGPIDRSTMSSTQKIAAGLGQMNK